MVRKELKATSPSGNPDYQYYLKNEADAVMDGLEEKIKELQEQSNKWEQDAYRQDERCLEFKKKYESLKFKLKELISNEMV